MLWEKNSNFGNRFEVNTKDASTKTMGTHKRSRKKKIMSLHQCMLGKRGNEVLSRMAGYPGPEYKHQVAVFGEGLKA